MDSDKSKNSRELDPKIKIKVEPGTSGSTVLTNVKIEAGLPSTRLTSFRSPRDWTLGGHVKLEKPKKLYTPNLNVQRNKAKDDHTTVKNNTKVPRERGRGRGQSTRGRGKGKVSDNIIQTDGVFSSGIADSSRAKKRFSSYRDGSNLSGNRSASTVLEKQKLNLNQKIDKAEEEEKLKHLLRDDFIENGAVPDMENAPVMLPMADDAQLYKKEFKEEPQVIKADGLDEDVKPVILENGKVSEEHNTAKTSLPKKSLTEEKKLITIPQIVANEANNYILLQFPDCLPGLKTDDELSDPKARRATDLGSAKPSDINPKTEYCTLKNLKEGMLGKLQILKSGQARLVLGDNKLIVDVGSHISFRQDLIAAKLDLEKLEGELINLGSVSSTLICLPDWESMLDNL
ncbi:DNA-directed RNA polymerase III subunit RPC4 isoform X2 [Neodiprion virginianus]|nr:DNA-directed RNA polymerase III subunit RPC4 isoform X2 [Neodiprion virginianus]XP_046625268.1 DNA-directed RNA polymerase III subunit RPC4 isoform X2 [Neodiprion virginianus]XP_046625277.1 DNA-directed RNA polymerase III subunit RPC4 isoform X2 [Neodiprion virginianus]XP_046625287.1 DNA-directed RNA polymerase III subunit RPC4 isoform X2 [Neodiprion virginianus]XP_046625296.1 DNA-directed RNA polymerase III subunit RPC4 isoform X2 [Neodiprion virginianus]XP_046625305.1 DNA-directed RNA pol